MCIIQNNSTFKGKGEKKQRTKERTRKKLREGLKRGAFLCRGKR